MNDRGQNPLFNIILGNPPGEISDFIYEPFDLYEIRGRVGESKGVIFEVHTNETCHVIPHVHAEYNGHQISIEIKTGRVIVGNLPRKQTNLATKWVLDHKEELLSTWKNITISKPIPLNQSSFDFKK